MAREAERLLDGTGWLPEPLRVDSTDLSNASIDTLPPFLNDDQAQDVVTEGSDQHPLAAE
jgi:ParB family chromosome partitioning protein